MIIYFSGTGNSRYCAQMLAAKLQDELIDSTQYIKHGIAAELISDRPWVFVFPIYAWQMPQPFENFLKSACLQVNKKAYFIITCGGDTGDAQGRCQKLCREIGLEFMGIAEVKMPNHYIIMFDVATEAEEQELLTAAGPTLEKLIPQIQNEQPLPTKKISPADKAKSSLIGTGFNKFYIKTDNFFTTTACTGCGKCVDSCPLNNISLQDRKPTWQQNCTHCMACICGCPTAAIEYGKSTKGRRRHICPEYTE